MWHRPLKKLRSSLALQSSFFIQQFIGKRKEEAHEVNPEFDLAVTGDQADDVEYETNSLEDIREISEYLPAGYLGSVVYETQSQLEDDQPRQNTNLARSKQDLSNMIKDCLAEFDEHEQEHDEHHDLHEHHQIQGQYEGVHLLYN